MLDEDYLGLHIFRFYIRCTMCCGVIAFKTDPKNTDYVCEQGATRNFENWRITNDDDEDAQEAQEEFEEQNPMAALEARTKESKQEMDILDALEEIKDLNAKNHTKLNLDDLLAAKADAKEKLLEQRRLHDEDEDDAAAAEAFATLRDQGGKVKRLDSSDEDEPIRSSDAVSADPGAVPALKAEPRGLGGSSRRAAADNLGGERPAKKSRQSKAGGLGILIKPKTQGKAPLVKAAAASKSAPAAAKPSGGLGLGLGVDYSSSESE